MPQYELMYLLGSNVADTEVPGLTEQVKKFAENFGAQNLVEQQLGKKKLAYPIGKTRNGHYVVVNFTMDGKKVNEFEARVRSMAQSIIRHILINLDEHLDRTAKDKLTQSKIVRKIPVAETVAKPVAATKAPPVEIDEKALDEKIEAALTEDVTK